MLISYCKACLFVCLFVIRLFARRGPEGAWRRRHTFIGDGPVVGVAAEEGYFFGHFFGSEDWTLK